MKLTDIVTPAMLSQRNRARPLKESSGLTQSAIDTLEIDRLVSANNSNLISTSLNFDNVEIDLAQLILVRLAAQPGYHPTQTVMQFIRSLNAKL